MIDDVVEHPAFGRGTIRSERHKGLEILVSFDDGVPRWTRLEDVRFLAPVHLVQTSHSHRATRQDEGFESRSMIESLRLGIVPYMKVQDFTFGRDHEIGLIDSWLDSRDTRSLAIEGEYGAGKSHILDYLCSLGLQRGYAVAKVNLDPGETPPFRPKAVYRRLIQSFRYRRGNQVGNFRDFLQSLARKGNSSHLHNHVYLREMLPTVDAPYDFEYMWDWIEGRESLYQPRLRDEGTAANVYCYILDGLAWGAANLLGLRGLLLVVDEAENVEHGSYTWYAEEKGLNLICGLMLLAGNDTRLRTERVVRQGKACVSTVVGEETGLIYSARDRPICRYCFLPTTALRAAFAFTPSYLQTCSPLRAGGGLEDIAYIGGAESLIDKLEERGAQLLRVPLQPLSEEALQEVFTHIGSTYSSAYGYPNPDGDERKCYQLVRERSRQQKTRYFVKGSVEILDLRRLRSEVPLGQLK